MKQNSLFSGFILFFLTLVTVEAQLKGYPPIDQPPPTRPEFTALVDLTKVPKAPVRKDAGQPCDGDKDPFCYWSCTNCLRKDDISVCPNQKDWGITYDDGPSEFTPKVLDYLKAKNVKATFFLVGSRVSENPEIAKRIHEEGHQIGVHTWSHTVLTSQTNEEIIAELAWTTKAIKDAVGITPVIMRPPQGDFDDRVRFISKALGLTPVIWDLDPNDWMTTTDPSYDVNWITGNFTQWVKLKSKTGHISLEHDLYKQTVGKAPQVIDIVMNAGFNIKSVGSCVNQPLFVGDKSNSTTPVSSSISGSSSSSAGYGYATTTKAASASASSSPTATSTPSAKQVVSKSPAAQSVTQKPQQQQAQTTTSSSSPSGKSSPSSTQTGGSFSAANSLTVNSVVGFGMTAIVAIVSSYF